jgi:magnesium transporter
MLHIHSLEPDIHVRVDAADALLLLDADKGTDRFVWIDLNYPTREEEHKVEAHLDLLLPTKDDMKDLATSSRLYVENGAAFMTVDVAFFGGKDILQSGPVTFVVTPRHLVTIRYIDPASFNLFSDALVRQPNLCARPSTGLLNLLDKIIDRTADLIQKTLETTDGLSRDIFHLKRREPLSKALFGLGRVQNDIARVRDSLASFSRMLTFAAGLEADVLGLDTQDLQEVRDRLRDLNHDISSLSDHTTYVTGNLTFLLDAALGMINIEQNTIIKLISITSMIFLPLTFLASIYGMNFKVMPYLNHPYGFWWMIGVMAVVTAALIGWFRMRRWV